MCENIEEGSQDFAILDEEEECRLSKLNRREVESQWRILLRRQKVDGLKSDVERLAERHSKEVQQKDRILRALSEGFDHAEDQFRTSVGSHLRGIEQLVDLHDDRLLRLEQDFQARLEQLRRECNAEKKIIIDQHESDKKNILDKVYLMDEDETRVAVKDQNDKQQVIEEIKNRTLEEINGLRFVFDTKIEDLEEQFEVAHVEYLQKNDQRNSDCELLSSKDNGMQKEIDQMQRKIEGLQASIRRVKATARQNSMQRKEANEHLIIKKDRFMGKYQNTKCRLNQFRDNQHKRLADLTKCANQCKASLQNKCDLAERVIKLIDVGEAIQQDRENVFIQLGDTRPDPNLETLENKAETLLPNNLQQLQPSGGHSRITTVYSNMDESYNVFWKKYNESLLDALSTEKKVEQLQKRNRKLCKNLKRYEDGISINDSVLSSNNPLLVVNGKVRPQRHSQRSRDTSIPAAS